eukprot:2800100-Rhodomonas_salina.2
MRCPFAWHGLSVCNAWCRAGADIAYHGASDVDHQIKAIQQRIESEKPGRILLGFVLGSDCQGRCDSC